MRLYEIMSESVETVAPGVPAAQAASLMKQKGIHHLVVAEGGKIRGVVSARDLSAAVGILDASEVRDLMSDSVVTAGPTMTVREAANVLRGRGLGCLPVVDRGRLVGMVTISDLLELLGRGAERPVPTSKRWTLKQRGVRRRSQAQREM